MNAVDIVLLFDITDIMPTPFNKKFWIDNNFDKMIDNNGNYIVFNVPTP